MIHTRLLLSAALACMFGPMLAPAARAHALLDHAVPTVGSTASAPHELRIWLTEAVEPAFSGVTVTNAAGDGVDDSKIVVDPDKPQELHDILKPLMPGTYRVQWHVLSVDTHRTEGNFSFTVAPG
jgi:hypothetical protein